MGPRGAHVEVDGAVGALGDAEDETHVGEEVGVRRGADGRCGVGGAEDGMVVLGAGYANAVVDDVCEGDGGGEVCGGRVGGRGGVWRWEEGGGVFGWDWWGEVDGLKRWDDAGGDDGDELYEEREMGKG